MNTQSATQQMQEFIACHPDTKSVANFKPSPEIQRLDLKFDLEKLREALHQVLGINNWQGEGFHAMPMTQRPGDTGASANDLSGRYYIRTDDSYQEYAREDLVDESAFSQLVPAFIGTYFEHVHTELTKRYPIGRMRILMKEPLTSNSWHRDPEPRIHIPIYTNPGSIFIVNHHVTHIPADGHAYFTDTRAYHTAVNGGETNRVHIVAALAYPPNDR
ncbi:MAG: hypothetical protein ACPG51_11185 [Thiolinea sp.]